jgi:four helix bundle protein
MQNREVRMQEPAKSFRQLIMWQKAHEFVLQVYKMTESFPRQELYRLISQLRRAAISIPANIAAGFKKSGTADKIQFLNIAQGSIEECQYYLILAKDLKYAEFSRGVFLFDEVAKLVEKYSQKIKASKTSSILNSKFYILFLA